MKKKRSPREQRESRGENKGSGEQDRTGRQQERREGEREEVIREGEMGERKGRGVEEKGSISVECLVILSVYSKTQKDKNEKDNTKWIS